MPDALFDLVVRNAQVATASDTFACDIGIRDGRIVQLGQRLGARARARSTPQGRVVTPGGVDAHCHLDQPMEAAGAHGRRLRHRHAARRPAAAPPP